MYIKYSHIKICLGLALLLFSSNASARLKLPNIIGDNMVLQSKQTLPVWGWADKQSTVIVKFNGQQKITRANDDGYWKIILSPLKPSAQPAKMLIVADKDSITLNNILVGEVWLCAGQSNMEYPMKNGYSLNPPAKGADSAALALTANDQQIRLFNVKRKTGVTDVPTDGWQQCRGEALAQFSAAAYFFAKNINKKLNVPVGVICSAWGGTQIEPWTPVEAFIHDPVLKNQINVSTAQINGVEAAKIFDSMIKPMAPFTIKGFIWYQGESNCITNEGLLYADKMRVLIKSWRDTWHNSKLPFYYALLAPHYYTHRKDKLPHTPETLALIWEAQYNALAIPYTDLIPTSDLVDDLNDIHPSYKWEVGRRFAALALAKQYGYKNLEFSGPRFKQIKVNGDKITISFTHASGLKTNDNGPVNWLSIAGNDGIFKDASAVIDHNDLIVWNDSVKHPVQVRLGWNETARPNLVNNANLPVIPFRKTN